MKRRELSEQEIEEAGEICSLVVDLAANHKELKHDPDHSGLKKRRAELVNKMMDLFETNSKR